MRKIFLWLWIHWCMLSTAFALNIVEVNEATEQQLTQLKGIGSKTAQMIIQERQRAGAFRSVQDFSARVKGMGKKKVERLLQQGMRVNGYQSFKISSSNTSPSKEAIEPDSYGRKKEAFAEGKIFYVRPKQIYP